MIRKPRRANNLEKGMDGGYSHLLHFLIKAADMASSI